MGRRGFGKLLLAMSLAIGAIKALLDLIGRYQDAKWLGDQAGPIMEFVVSQPAIWFYGSLAILALIGLSLHVPAHAWSGVLGANRQSDAVPNDVSREPYRRGYVKERGGTPITTERLRRFVGFNTHVIWADREIARRQGVEMQFFVEGVEIVQQLLASVDISTMEELEKLIKKHRKDVVRLTDVSKHKEIYPGESLTYLFYWIGAERGPKFLHQACESTGRISGAASYYNEIVFARDQLKPLKNRSVIS